MSETTFHLMDAATGRFLRQYGDPMYSRTYISVDGDGPAYSTTEIADIHRLMRLEEGVRSPHDLPAVDHVEDEFYCVAAVKRYGSVVPGGDQVLLSTDLMKVDLEDLRTPRIVPSRKYSETARILLKRYIPESILAGIDTMKPEFLVVNGTTEPISAGEFVLTEDWSATRIGEVVNVTPLPEDWPLAPSNEEEGLVLLLVDYASKASSYRVSELSLQEQATPSNTPRPLKP